MKAFLFDFDGVVADSEPLHLETFRQILAPLGINITEERWYVEFAGKGSPHIMKILLSEVNMTDEKVVKEYVDRRRGLYNEKIKQGLLKEKVGLKDFLIMAKERKIKTAIVSGGHKKNILFALSKLNIEKYFEAIICREDYKNNKPSPECYLMTSKIIGVDIKDCIAFEDSASGCFSAESAGAKVVFVESPSVKGLKDCKSILTIKDFSNLTPDLILNKYAAS